MSAHILFKYHPGDALSLTGTTFTRASGAHYVDAAGVMQVAAADAVRDASYSGADGIRRLLLESSRTNLVPYGEPTIAQVSYRTAGVTDTSAARDMGRLAFAANTGATEYALQQVTLAADATVVLSIYLDTDDDPTPIVGADGTSTLNLGGPDSTWVRGPSTVAPVGARFWRATLQMAAPAGTAKSIGISRVSTSLQRLFRIAGWQLEVGAAASSYIHTTGAPATRAADVMTTPLSAGVAATRYERYIDQATLGLVERATPYTTPASLVWEVDRAWEAQCIAAGTWSFDAMRALASQVALTSATALTARATVRLTVFAHGWLTGTVSATPTLTGTVSLDSTPTP